VSATGSGSRVRVERGIYKRSTRSGETRYEIAFVDSDGRQRWRTVDRLQEARKLRAKLVAKVDSGERVAPSRATLAEWAAEWLADQEPRLRPRTLEHYASSLRLHVLPRLGRRRLTEVTVDDVARLVAELQRGGYAAWTIRGLLTVLGRMLASAERRGLIAANPVRKLERGERPKVERREFPVLDREAVARLVAAAPARYRLLIAVSLATGVRQGEALGLRWQDVDLKAGELRVRHQLGRDGTLAEPKTDTAKRAVPLTSDLARALAEHRLASPFSSEADFVFCSEAGTPLSHRNVVRRGLEPALRAAGLPHLRWHDLRHLAASAMIAQGMDDDDIAPVLGHASSVVTKTVYGHLFERGERDRRTRQGMEAAFGGMLR
jgi:integrase